MELFIFGLSLGLAAALVNHQVFVRPRIKSAVSELRSIRSAIEPVPVSERLPGPEDCDAEGRCWYFFMDSVVGGCGWQMFNEEENELLAPSHFWLPRWALPVPELEGGND
jgi:hypothetical protein